MAISLISLPFFNLTIVVPHRLSFYMLLSTSLSLSSILDINEFIIADLFHGALINTKSTVSSGPIVSVSLKGISPSPSIYYYTVK